MNKRETCLQVKLSDSERYQLQSYADLKGWTMSQVVRQDLRQLPGLAVGVDAGTGNARAIATQNPGEFSARQAHAL